MESRQVSFKFEETDPQLLASFKLGQGLYDVLEIQLQQIGLIPISGADGEEESVRQWTLYIGTLFAEIMFGCVQVTLFQTPRVQHSLNRQLFEYHIRNQWMLKNPAIAKQLFDTLPRAARKEVRNAPNVLAPEAKAVIERNAQEWETQFPELAKKTDPDNLKTMCSEIRNAESERDYFWLYTMPSLLVHAKPLGIPDVVSLTKTKQKERNPNSISLNRLEELNKTIGIALQYTATLALKYEVERTNVNELNARFGEILVKAGVTPEVVTVTGART